MHLRNRLKQCETLVGLVRDGRRLVRCLQEPRCTLNSLRGRMFRLRRIQAYLASTAMRKLQIGAGPHQLAGWLCSDVDPQLEGAVYLDAREKFPFEDGVFDYVYSEHMIEHIPWQDGLFMLRECRRILKPGGTLRLATPDLQVLADLYREDGGPERERYIRWITDTFLSGVKAYKPAFVINNAFRRWGHQFLYDGDVLTLAMQEAGFVNVRRCVPGQSSHENLTGIESHGKDWAHDLMVFETMVFEGDCSE